MTRKLIFSVVAVAALIGLGACDKELEVSNPNQGDTGKVLGTPADAENLLGTYYKRWSAGVYNTGVGGLSLEGMANVQSLMNYSSLANNCQNSHAPFSGAVNNNQSGNTCKDDQYRLFQYMGEVNRVASSFLKQVKGGLTMGSAARDNRDKAFAEWLRGMSLGYTALMHDSGAVVTDAMDAADPGALVSYKVMADSAYAAFERAIVLSNAPAAGTDGFPIPQTWLPSPTTWSATEFVRLVRSYRARIRANMARTPAERAAVDWPAVIADAAAGITANHEIITSTTAGPGNAWRQTYDAFSTWHQMPPFIIGMGDVSGSYAAWIALPLGERGANNSSFLMVTPDRRFPQGTSRAAQQADFAIDNCGKGGQVCKHKVGNDSVPVYFVNRPAGGDNYAGSSFGQSNYDFVRFHSWVVAGDANSARNGKTPFMMKAEMDLLRAEGLYRANNYAGAAALVNISRIANGLPEITVFDATTPVPGGANCVPKVPVAPSFNTIACGNLWEALKYEKRIETAFTHYAPWYLDMRGWGDLPENTPLFWAIPYQDLQARGRPNSALYGAGPGTGNAPGSSAAKGTYGW